MSSASMPEPLNSTERAILLVLVELRELNSNVKALLSRLEPKPVIIATQPAQEPQSFPPSQPVKPRPSSFKERR